ncbi:hypothetical protein BDY24DRAFT_418102 [Mrakia frigida]|uniref:uncharacterized protein n=1 Tax=Mrakia frigida TaxID=29902 RepID=UPI003FCC0F31
MPKATTSTSEDGSGAEIKKPRGSGKKANALKRFEACDSCRKRRMRCDALRPACGTCIRSHNHIISHLKPHQQPPPYPQCVYEEPPTSTTSPNGHSSSSSSSKPKPTAATPRPPVERVSELESRVQQLEGMLKMAVGQGTGSPGSTSLFRQNIQGGDQNAAGLSSSRSGDAGSGSTSLPSFSFGLGGIESPLRAGESRVLPPPTWQGHSYEPTPPPLGSPGPSSHFPPFSLPPLPPPPQHHDPSSSSSSSRTFVVGNGYSPFPHPYQTNRQPPFFPPTNSPLQRHQQFGGVASEPWSNPSPSIYQPFPPFQLPPEPVPTPSPSVSASMSAPESTFLSPAAGEERGGGGATTRTSSVTGPSLEELLEDRHEGVSSLEGILNGAVPGGLGVEMEVGDHGVAMAGGEDLFLLQLLWPAWPSHLPSPGKLEHIVEAFFTAVPFANLVLNKPRFLARLALPPKHKNFPHPCLLHAICAVSCRYIGELVLVPVSDTPLHWKRAHDRAQQCSQSDADRNELKADAIHPKWDGYGPPPPGTTRGVDEDFGQIHGTWCRLYVDKVMNEPQHWLEAVQALLFLSQYQQQHARLCIPLDLNARPHLDRRTVQKSSLVPPAKDQIEETERRNLFWAVFCVDSWSSASSGWQGTLTPTDIWIPLPSCHANVSFDPPLAPASQFGDTPGIFTQHPPEHSSPFSLFAKATLLLRHITEFVRREDMQSHENPREGDQFKHLDALLFRHKASYPAPFKTPYIPSDDAHGLSIDRDVLLAQAVPHVAMIQLHDRYWDPTNPLDPSIPHLRDAVRGLLEHVHALSRTTFQFSLLHPFMLTAWYLGARTLLRFLQNALVQNETSELASILCDIQVFQNAMARVGDRLPLGHRQGKMFANLLDEVISGQPQDCNFPSKFRFALPNPNNFASSSSSYPRFAPAPPPSST